MSEIKNFSAPVGGWASVNSFASVNANTALILKNLVPSQNSSKVRGGSEVACVVTGSVMTLMSYNDGAIVKLLAAAAGKVYEIPVSVNFGAKRKVRPEELLSTAIELATGKQSAAWQYVSMANAADAVKLVCVNGFDGMHVYDGATFVRHIPTTNDKLTFNNITEFKGRLWCTDQGSSIVYYGDVLSNTPANMIAFPVGPFLRKGGSITLIDSMSVDGGSGPDDYLVMISDRGEILVWRGIDPADDFQLVGVFNKAKPLGFRCLKKMGTDLVYFSETGPEYLSDLLPAAGTVSKMSVPIRTEFERVIFENHLAFGWDFVLYSRRGWVLFNIPIVAPSEMHQYVLNLETQTWFEITDWNAQCWVQHGSYIVFGDPNGNIVVADYGQNDRGNAINVDYMQSWSEFETASKKKFNMAQMTIKSNTKPEIMVDIMVNYEEVMPENIPAFGQKAVSSPWDISPWNISPWSGSEHFFVNTFGLNDLGYVGALRYRTSINDATHELFGFRIAFEEGEIL